MLSRWTAICLVSIGLSLSLAGTGCSSLPFEDDFESGSIDPVDPREYPDNLPLNIWYESWWNQPAWNDPIRVISEAEGPVRAGEYALKATMVRVGNAKSRSETGVNIPYDGDPERWYGFSTYVPRQDFVGAGLDKCVIAQWGNWKNNASLPDFALRITPTSFRLTQEHPGVEYLQWESELITDQWVDWVVHAVWSDGDDGLFEVWQDGVRVLRIEGPTTDGQGASIKSKIGLYWGGWQDVEDPSVTTLEAYYDEYRVGDSQASYEDVRPGADS